MLSEPEFFFRCSEKADCIKLKINYPFLLQKPFRQLYQKYSIGFKFQKTLEDIQSGIVLRSTFCTFFANLKGGNFSVKSAKKYIKNIYVNTSFIHPGVSPRNLPMKSAIISSAVLVDIFLKFHLKFLQIFYPERSFQIPIPKKAS